MPKKQILPPTPEKLQMIVTRQRDYTIEKIKNNIGNYRKKYKIFNIEQKVMILKLLQLNEMDYTTTARQAGIVRQTISKWEEAYGDIVFASRPEEKIAERLETDLAIIKSDVLKKAYRTINTGLDKISELSGKAMSVRQIYAIKEGLMAAVEVVKAEKSETPVQPATNDFYFQIHQLMINNIPPDNGNNNKP